MFARISWVLHLTAVASITLATLGSAASIAEEFSTERAMARVFFGYCAQNAGRNDKVAAMARALNYEELTPDLKLALGPQDSDMGYDGWKVKESSGLRYLLGVSRYEADGQTYAVCSIATPLVDLEQWLTEIDTISPRGDILGNHSDVGQRLRRWEFPIAAPNTMIWAADSPSLGAPGGSVYLVSPITE